MKSKLVSLIAATIAFMGAANAAVITPTVNNSAFHYSGGDYAYTGGRYLGQAGDFEEAALVESFSLAPYTSGMQVTNANFTFTTNSYYLNQLNTNGYSVYGLSAAPTSSTTFNTIPAIVGGPIATFIEMAGGVNVYSIDLTSFINTMYQTGQTANFVVKSNGPNIADGLSNWIYINGNEAIDYTIATSSDVPEPASLALAGIGLLAAMAARRKAKSV
jgi:hypothetical protein